MDADALRLVVIALVLGALALWVLTTLFFRVSGTWERILTHEEQRAGVLPERVTLGQLGPFVTGRRDIQGGHQELSGLMVLRGLTLHRRDFGVAALRAMGFPDAIATRLDGEIMGRLRLRLTDAEQLVGTFEPQKIEFTHQPPRVTRTFFLPGQPRRYRRVEPATGRLPVFERVPALDEARTEGRPA